MKKLIVAVIVSVLGFFSSEECKAQYSSLKFGDFGITSISPAGFTSVKGSVWVEVENPQAGFTVSKVEGKLYKNGVPMIEGYVEDYYVPTGNTRVELYGRTALCPGTSIIDVLGLMLFNPEEYTVDIKAVITDDGADPVIKEVKDIPILTLLKKDETSNTTTDESTDSK